MSTPNTTVVSPPASDLARVTPMPGANVRGSGRDRRFELPQYFARIDGVRTAFADAGEGKALIFLHGLAGNVTHWVNVAPRFVGSHRVIAIDMPGHGETDSLPRGYSIRMYVRQVLGLMDILGIEKAAVIGHSMGGMVATSVSLVAPERVGAAILVNPAGMQPVARPLRIAGRLLLRRPILNRLLPRVWRGILANVFYRDNEYTRAFIRTVDETYEDSDVLEMSHTMESLRTDLLARDYAAMLPQLHTPVGLIWGDKDRLVPARVLHRAATRLPNVTVEEIPRCGHMPIIERPERVVRFIERTLETAGWT